MHPTAGAGMVMPKYRKAEFPMRRNAVALALALLVGGCQPMPPMSTNYGAGAAPCGWRAVDNGMCPYVGYRRPIYR